MMCKIPCTHTHTHTHTHPTYTIYTTCTTHIRRYILNFEKPVLNGFMSLGQPVYSEARKVIQKLLSKDEVL